MTAPGASPAHTLAKGAAPCSGNCWSWGLGMKTSQLGWVLEAER